MIDDLEIPAFLNLRLSAEEREAAAAKLPKPAPTTKGDQEPTWEERLEAGRAQDREQALLFATAREQHERITRLESLENISPESREKAKLNRRLKKYKPKKANDAAAKPRRKRKKVD
jgi:hypothetical protein